MNHEQKREQRKDRQLTDRLTMADGTSVSERKSMARWVPGKVIVTVFMQDSLTLEGL